MIRLEDNRLSMAAVNGNAFQKSDSHGCAILMALTECTVYHPRENGLVTQFAFYLSWRSRRDVLQIIHKCV